MISFKNLLGKKSGSTRKAWRIGRFTDAYKLPHQYQSWDDAEHLFSKGAPHDGLKKILPYFLNDSDDNLEISSSEGKLSFSMIQGSKQVLVDMDDARLRAEAPVARFKTGDASWMEDLLVYNQQLDYCRFAIRDDRILLIFDSSIQDLTPYKLYYAIKELATHADKQDDLLIHDYDDLMALPEDHTLPIADTVKVKLAQAFSHTLKERLESIQKTPRKDLRTPGELTYQILDLVYQLDLVFRPQGTIMDRLESIHAIYFNHQHAGSVNRNEEAIEILEDISRMEDDELLNEFYAVRHTFGVTRPVTQATIQALVRGEVKNLEYYVERNDVHQALSVVGYTIGFALFSYAPPEPISDFLKLYYRVLHSQWLGSIDGQRPLVKDGVLLKRPIERLCKSILENHQSRFPNLATKFQPLDYRSMAHFSVSLLKMVVKLDTTETQPNHES